MDVKTKGLQATFFEYFNKLKVGPLKDSFLNKCLRSAKAPTVGTLHKTFSYINTQLLIQLDTQVQGFALKISAQLGKSCFTL